MRDGSCRAMVHSPSSELAAARPFDGLVSSRPSCQVFRVVSATEEMSPGVAYSQSLNEAFELATTWR